MKTRMTGPSFGIAFDAAAPAGGGTAVAAPPVAAAAPAPAAAAPAPVSAATSGPGYFKGLPTSTVQVKKPDPVVAADPATTVAKPAEPAVAAAAAPAVTAPVDALPRAMMGRYTTFTQAEEAMRRSQDEGQRLHAENKTLREKFQSEVANRDTELASLRAELETARTTPAFKELTKEEFAALAKENPAEAIEYAALKRERDHSVRAAKDNAARQESERHEHVLKVNKLIETHDLEMRNDPKTYPKFEDMNPTMEGILNITKAGGDHTVLRGQPWANEFLYLAALGHTYRQLLAAGTEVEADAAKTARLTAEAVAASTVAGKGDGSASGAAVVDPAKKADEDWRKAVLGSQPKPFFKPASTT